MFRRRSLRTRFFAAAVLCLVPVLAAIVFVFDQSLTAGREQIFDTDSAIADVVSQGLSATIDENQLALAELAKDPRMTALEAEQISGALTEVRLVRPSLNGLFVLDAEGNVMASAGGVDPAAVSAEIAPAVDTALTAGEPSVSPPIALAESEVTVIAIVVPILPSTEDGGTQGTPIGVLGSFLNLNRIQGGFIPPGGYSSADTSITLLRRQSSQDNPEILELSVVATSLPAEEVASIAANQLVTDAVVQAQAGQRARLTLSDGMGGDSLVVIAPVAHPDVSWVVLVATEAPIGGGLLANLASSGAVAIAVAVAIALAMALFFGEIVARPLRQLTRQATAVSAGADGGAILPTGGGEVAELSEAFRTMADRLTTQVRDTESAREEVARQAERLRELLRRTVRLQEDERRRIASDIHDAVSPLITGALYQTRAMHLSSNGHNGGSADGAGELTTVNELLERAMAELHDVIFALRPPDLDDLGVVAAIERYVGQINRTGLQCSLEVIGEPRRMSPEARLGVYRIVQEALHNALRHAHADDAFVRMEWQEERLKVTIQDNGSGFDPDLATNPGSLGLLSMRERAAAIGGTLEIVSRLGAGTAIILDYPLTLEIVAESPVGAGDDVRALPASESGGA